MRRSAVTIGPDASGWDGPAVTGGRRTLGSLLLVEPNAQIPEALHRATEAAGSSADFALMPFDGPGWLITALASDAVTLRQQLDRALEVLGRTQPTAAT